MIQFRRSLKPRKIIVGQVVVHDPDSEEHRKLCIEAFANSPAILGFNSDAHAERYIISQFPTQGIESPTATFVVDNFNPDDLSVEVSIDDEKLMELEREFNCPVDQLDLLAGWTRTTCGWDVSYALTNFYFHKEPAVKP